MEQNTAANRIPTCKVHFLSSLFLEHHLNFLIFVVVLAQGKTNHIPVKGEIPALPDVIFPASPPSLLPLPFLLYFLLLN